MTTTWLWDVMEFLCEFMGFHGYSNMAKLVQIYNSYVRMVVVGEIIIYCFHGMITRNQESMAKTYYGKFVDLAMNNGDVPIVLCVCLLERTKNQGPCQNGCK